LEQSNATIATETATLEIWEQQRRLLQQIAPDSHRTTVLQ
jgi:hypothetical protein